MKDEKLTFGVIMSIYKHDNLNHLKESIMSLTKFDSDFDEYVVVIDGPDTSNHLAVVISNFDSNKLRIIKNKRNIGLGLSLKKAIKAAKADILCRMDSDDINLVSRRRLCEKFFLENSNLSMIGGQINEFNENSNQKSRRKVPLKKNDIKAYARFRNPFNHVTMCLRKTHIVNVGSYQDCKWHEDYDLWTRLISSNYDYMNLNTDFVDVRVDGLANRRSGFSYFASEVKFIIKNINFFKLWCMPYLLLRVPLRFCPNFILEMIYKISRKI